MVPPATHNDATPSERPSRVSDNGSAHAPAATSAASKMKPVSRVGDRIFSGVSSTIAVLLAILVLVILAFLVWHAVPALSDNSENFFTSRKWATGESPQ